jgi:phosphoglycolate phosphatase-like HAD superfamily hydrolase
MYFSFFKPQDWRKRSVVRGRGFIQRFLRKAVYVGDTAGDENASKEAGIPFIWARYGFGTATNPDGIISTISELKTCVERYI